jgi:uncharacterized protein with gpF-like domain
MRVVEGAAARQSKRVLDRIQQMDAQGASMSDIKAEVRRMIGKRGNWSRTLATNVIGAATQGAQEAVYSRTGGLYAPTWRTHQDERVRTSHRALDGKRPGNDGIWHALGGPLRFPNDPMGAPSEVINCRCWLTWDIDYGKV